MRAPVELFPETNEPCVGDNGTYCFRGWSYYARRTHLPAVDIGFQNSDPSLAEDNIMDPDFAIDQVYSRLGAIDQKKLVAGVMYRLCQKRSHDRSPLARPGGTSLEVVHAFAVVGDESREEELLPISDGDINGIDIGVGNLHLKLQDGSPKASALVHGIVPTIHRPRLSLPPTRAVQAMTAQEGGSVYVAVTDETHIVRRSELTRRNVAALSLKQERAISDNQA